MSTLIPKKIGTFWLNYRQQLSVVERICPLLMEWHKLQRSIRLTGFVTESIASEEGGTYFRIRTAISRPNQKIIGDRVSEN
jgi:pyridoxine/pyridoxamine 5'-phosphate oxidase